MNCIILAFFLFYYFYLGTSKVSVKKYVGIYFLLLKILFLFSTGSYLCMLLKQLDQIKAFSSLGVCVHAHHFDVRCGFRW